MRGWRAHAGGRLSSTKAQRPSAVTSSGRWCQAGLAPGTYAKSVARGAPGQAPSQRGRPGTCPRGVRRSAAHRCRTASAVSVTRHGPVLVVTFAGGRGVITYSDLGGADAAAIRRLVPESLALLGRLRGRG